MIAKCTEQSVKKQVMLMLVMMTMTRGHWQWQTLGLWLWMALHQNSPQIDAYIFANIRALSASFHICRNRMAIRNCNTFFISLFWWWQKTVTCSRSVGVLQYVHQGASKPVYICKGLFSRYSHIFWQASELHFQQELRLRIDMRMQVFHHLLPLLLPYARRNRVPSWPGECHPSY